MSLISFSESFENEITQLIKEHESADLAADLLLKKYQLITLAKSEFEAIGNFLINAGLHQAFINFTLQKISDGSAIPWGHFAHSLSKATGGQIDLQIKFAIYFAAEESSSVADLAKTRAFDEYRPEIEIHRKVKLRDAAEKNLVRRREIQEQLDIYRTQNLFEQEDRVLNFLMMLEPDNNDLLRQRADLRERMAQDILSKKFNKTQRKFTYNFIENKDEQTKALIENIYSSMKLAVQRSPQLAADFTIALIVLDEYEKALEMNSLCASSPQKDWLKAEMLLLSRRFLDALSEIDLLEAKYESDPESLFSANYLRAQALWGMDRRSEAIELMEEMLQARPHFRAANSLLSQWKEDMI